MKSEVVETSVVESAEKKPWRGFGSMDRDRVREIASNGGKKAQASGKGHRFTTEEARLAGSKGGSTKRTKKATVEP